MNALRWLARHWYLPLLVVVGAVGFLVGGWRRGGSPLDSARSELDAIDAGEKARRLAALRGKEAANAAADSEYRRALDAMDARQSRKADNLRNDPAKRTRFLARVSRKRPDDPI